MAAGAQEQRWQQSEGGSSAGEGGKEVDDACLKPVGELAGRVSPCPDTEARPRPTPHFTSTRGLPTQAAAAAIHHLYWPRIVVEKGCHKDSLLELFKIGVL